MLLDVSIDWLRTVKGSGRKTPDSVTASPGFTVRVSSPSRCTTMVRGVAPWGTCKHTRRRHQSCPCQAADHTVAAHVTRPMSTVCSTAIGPEDRKVCLRGAIHHEEFECRSYLLLNIIVKLSFRPFDSAHLGRQLLDADLLELDEAGAARLHH